ncbi:MAG: hypothetical protein C4K60_02250 [Ideonella sp. MAG2]|nr:MAG: hypothetical protein C4K60_02250 [Ideonella sp. MAG2]
MSTVSAWLATVWAWALPPQFEAEQERAYRLMRHQQLLPVRRVASMVAALVWCLYIPRDYLLASVEKAYAVVLEDLIAIRLLVAAVFLFTHWHFFSSRRVLAEPGYGDQLIVAAAAVVFLGLSGIVMLLPHPYDQLYGVLGLALVVSATYGLFGLPMRAALFLVHWQLALVAITLWWCITHKLEAGASVATQQFAYSAALLMCTFVGVGCTVCWLQEVNARRSFLDRQVLAQQNEKISLHGQALQQLNDALALSGAQAQERLQAVIRLQERLHHEAEARSRERAQFMANAVHDLRQPVQAIMAAMYPVANALERGDRDTVAQLLHLSHQATHFLQNQLTGMLEIARLESGRVQPDLSWVELGALTQETVAAYSAQAQIEGVNLVVERPAEASWVCSDAQFLRRIVGNLVSNGIKYRRAEAQGGAWVRVIVSSLAGRASVQVVDNGQGIAEELLTRGMIFQPFFQANNLLAQAEKGVGLGLAVVQKLVALLNEHTLDVSSTVGQGSRFTLSLPQTSVDAVAVSALQQARAMDLPSLAGLYLVLVEDDEIVRESLSQMFRVMGVLCEPFADYQALAAAVADFERCPDVLISDYRLPAGRTALDVRRLHEAEWPQVPMLILTGEPLDAGALPGLEGVTILCKPVAMADLLRTLARVSRSALAQTSSL